jgi:hypothetical protein
LVEISTGRVVEDARYDIESLEAKIKLKVASDGEPKGYSPSKVAKIVKAASRKDLGWVVNYCLLRNVPPDEIKQKHLKSFYNWVVAL